MRRNAWQPEFDLICFDEFIENLSSLLRLLTRLRDTRKFGAIISNRISYLDAEKQGVGESLDGYVQL
jgi:hypothetical protein